VFCLNGATSLELTLYTLFLFAYTILNFKDLTAATVSGIVFFIVVCSLVHALLRTCMQATLYD